MVRVGQETADHKDIYMTLQKDNIISNVKHLIIRPMSEKGMNLFETSLLAVDWSFVNQPIPINHLWEMFIMTIYQIYLECFPEKVRKISDKSKMKKSPWYSQVEEDMKQKVTLLYDLSKSDKESELWKVYKIEKRKYLKHLQKVKLDYNASQIKDASNRAKKAWELVNIESGKNNKVQITANIKPDTFNKYYIDISKRNQINCTMNAKEIIDSCKRRPQSVFFLAPVTKENIIYIVSQFKNSNTKDCFGFSSKLLKKIIYIILTPLHWLVNESLMSGQFPEVLKLTKVVPLYKKGDKSDPSSYRPVSLTPVFSKLLETIVKEQLVHYLESNKLLSDNQFGYRPGRSTTLAVMKVVNKAIIGLEKGEYVQLTCVDLKKAFDTMPHEIFNYKLDYFGIEGNSKTFLMSFYESRHQFVAYDGAESGIEEIEEGAGQGSVIGPLAFIMDQDDLNNYLETSAPPDFDEDAAFFSDDSNLIHSNSDPNALRTAASLRLDKVSEWLEANHFTLSVEKTQYLTFSLRSNISQEPIKLLGIILDSKLTWIPHVNMVHKKISSYIYVLRKLRKCLPQEILRLVYLAMIQSRLAYGIILWGHANIISLLLLQKKCMRLITKAKYDEHCKPIFEKLNIMSVYNLYIYNVLVYIKINVNNFKTNSSNHNYNTKNKDTLEIPTHRLKKSEVGQCILGIKLYNALPVRIKNLDYLLFKKELKAILTENPFYNLNEYYNFIKTFS